MPIQLQAPQDSDFPTAMQKIAEQDRRLRRFGATAPQYNEDLTQDQVGGQPNDPSLAEVWGAQVGQSVWQSVVDAGTRAATTPAERDPDFNPFEHIRNNPRLRNDPEVQMLVERGQFDDSENFEQFQFDLHAGKRFLEDAQMAQNATWTQFGLTTAGQMLIELGVTGGTALAAYSRAPFISARLAAATRGLNRTTRVALGSAFGGAETLASEELRNRLTPISDQPGAVNEVIAASTGAALAGGMVGAGELFDAALSGASNRKIAQLHTDLIKMMREPVRRRTSVRQGESVEGPPVQSVGADIDREQIRADSDLTLSSLNDEIANGRVVLQELLDEEPTEYRTVSVLHRPGDENSQLLEQLQEKYDAAGVSLRVTDHPDQWFYDLTAETRDIMEDPGFNAEAAPEDFDYNFATRLWNQAAGKYSGALSKVTPGGRLAESNLGRINDVYRTLSGSAQTVTTGQARDPFGFRTGAPAENIRGIYEARKDHTRLNIRQIYRRARKTDDRITYDGQEIKKTRGFAEFGRAAVDLARREHAQRQGYDVTVPDDTHALIKEAADTVRRQYFLRMRDEAELTGELGVGPRALEDARRELENIEARASQARDEAQRASDEAAPLFVRPFSQDAVTQRLDEIAGEFDPLEDMRVRVRAVEEQAGEGSSVQFLDDRIADGETFAISPEEWNGLDGATKQRIQQRVPVQVNEELAASLQDAIGTETYDRVLDFVTAGGSKSAIRSRVARSVLNRPEEYDPETLVDALVHQIRSDLAPGERNILHDRINPADLPEGVHFRIYGRDFWIAEDGPGRIFTDGNIEIGVDEVSAIPVERTSIEDLDVPTASGRKRKTTRSQRRAERLDRKAARQRDRIASIEKAVEDQKFYLPRVFDGQKIMARPEEFRRKLAESFWKSDQIVNGRRVPDAERPVLAEVAENLDRDRIVRAAIEKARREADGELTEDQLNAIARRSTRELVEDMQEGDLPDGLFQVYRNELSAYYDRNARTVFEKLTDPKRGDAVAEGLSQDPLKNRLLTIDESDLSEFLENDLDRLMEKYHRATSGRIAVRRAIQLDPQTWGNARLRDGSPVRTGEDLVEYLRESVRTLRTFAAHSDQINQRAGKTFGRMLPKVDALERRIERDVAMPLDFLQGKTPKGAQASAMDFPAFLGRSLLRLSMMNKLGSVIWAQINDFAPLTLHVAQKPRSAKHMARAMGRMIPTMKELPQRDLEITGLMFNQFTRSRSITDTDYLNTGQGFGTGLTRELSARAEEALRELSDFNARISGMNWITDVGKRTAGAQVLDRLTFQSKRFLRANQIMQDEGVTMNQALERVGLSRYDATRLNKLGLNAERARKYHQLVYNHGLTKEDEPISEVMSFDEYMGSEAFFKPNFNDWPTDAREVKDLYDTLTANVNGEVERNMIVTPGTFDRPIINYNTWGRLFNQLHGFMIAFTNQRLKPMAQMPAKYQMWYAASYLALGALSDAISNHLSGRRSFDETARLWQENPMGMTYAAFERSGLSGWLGRPLVLADVMGIPWSPGNLFDNTTTSTAARHMQTGNFLEFFGPAAGDVGRIGMTGRDLLAGQADETTAYNAWKVMPFQNLFWLRMAQQATDTPLTPGALIGGDDEDEEPRP